MSLYYDSPEKDFYREKWLKLETRKKLRLRRYVGEQSELPAQEKIFIEIKEHTPFINYKRRIQLRADEAYELLHHGEMPILENPEDEKVAQEILTLVNEYQLKPSALTAYQRQAYKVKKRHGGLRITFDSDIKYSITSLSLNWQEYYEDLVDQGVEVMEIKVNGQLPEWIQSILDQCGIVKMSFSKYAQAIELGFAGALNPPLNLQIDDEYRQQWNASNLHTRVGAYDYVA